MASGIGGSKHESANRNNHIDCGDFVSAFGSRDYAFRFLFQKAELTPDA